LEEVFMAEKTRLLVVANRTADSDELFETLAQRARQGEITVTLIVPQDSHGGLGERMTAGVARMRSAGIDARGMLGDVDPAVAVMDVWDPARYDEVVVSTLPTDESRWVRLDLPHRIEEITHTRVTHVVAHEHRQVHAMT
jgi:hypothetical protein